MAETPERVFGSKGGGESESGVEADAAREPRLADPARSRAVLIDGDSPHAPGTEVSGLALRFRDPGIWGLPPRNCRIPQVTDPVKLRLELESAAKAATEAFVVCFKGSAIQGTGGDWLLALDPADMATAGTMLPLGELMEIVSASPADLRLVVLDCDRAIGTSHLARFPGVSVFYGAESPGIGSGPPRAGLLVTFGELLAEGVPGAPELLELGHIANAIGMSGRALVPDLASTDLAIARNRAFGHVSPSHHVPWQHDTPAARDLLQRGGLARILGKRLRQVTAEAPDVSFLVHIDGQWGAGKSTLLNLLAEDLTTDREAPFLVVGFNAWRHSRVEPTWYPLLTAVRDRVVRSRPWYHCRFLRLRETWTRIRHAGASWALPMAVTSAVIVAGVFALRADWDPVGSGATVSVVGLALAAAGLLWPASRVAARLFLWNSARGARIFEQSHKDPMGELATHFAWLLRRSSRPVVIFIDDLDRCDQETVVETLEVVQNLIREGPADEPHPAASFVVSADGAWLRCAFEGRFEAFKSAIDEPGRPLGYLFQDKLFQLSVPLRFLPAVQQSSYVESLLTPERDTAQAADADTSRRIEAARSEAEVIEIMREAPADVRVQVAVQAAVKMAEPEIQRSTEHALLKFTHLLQPNPRGIKRFLNTYTVLRSLRTLEGLPIDLDTLAVWAVIRSRWPQFADELEARPERLDELGAGEPDPVSAEVRAFLAALPTELTSREVRECCGNRPGTGETTPL